MNSSRVSILLSLLFFQAPLPAETLEDLLRPAGGSAVLSGASADEAWKKVVEAFRANDMAKATEEGNKFLTGDIKPSALQLLGVKVMLALADGAAVNTTFESREDQELYKKLSEERTGITKQFNDLRNIISENNATINRITMDRKRPVQEGSSNYLACMECSRQIERASKELEKLQEPIEKNKREMEKLQKKASGQLKPMAMQLLDNLIDSGEMDAATAIANTYIRKIGNDMDIAMKQQDIVRLQQAAEKAGKVVELLKAEVGPLMKSKLYWEASEKKTVFLAKVETMSEDKDLLRMVKAKSASEPAGLDRHMAAGQRRYDLIRAQAELDSSLAMRELALFKADYPDHPQGRELEMFIGTVKTKSADALLVKMESDFEELKKRFDPEKLRLRLTRTAEVTQRTPALFGSNVSSLKSDAEALAELGVAPSDVRVVKSSLQGLSAGLNVLEKTSLPDDRKVRLATIKVSVESLLLLLR